MSAIGFSTGAIALGDFQGALQLLDKTRANVLELSALRVAELPILLKKLPELVRSLNSRYKYISFHAPTNFTDETALVKSLTLVAHMNINIIVHPDTIKNVIIWRQLGKCLCLENMDSRKKSGRTAQELKIFFDELPDAKLCFDIAHARQVDSSMTEGLRIIEAFGDRLAQVHLSEVNSQGAHFMMSFSAKRAYQPFVKILSTVPVILEAMVDNDEIVNEIQGAQDLLDYQWECA